MYKKIFVSNFLHLNLSFRQLEGQFSIFELWVWNVQFLRISLIRLTGKGISEKLECKTCPKYSEMQSPDLKKIKL